MSFSVWRVGRREPLLVQPINRSKTTRVVPSHPASRAPLSSAIYFFSVDVIRAPTSRAKCPVKSSISQSGNVMVERSRCRNGGALRATSRTSSCTLFARCAFLNARQYICFSWCKQIRNGAKLSGRTLSLGNAMMIGIAVGVQGTSGGSRAILR